MEGFANLVSMMDYVLDTKRKRHITGGLLLSAALLFGGLAFSSSSRTSWTSSSLTQQRSIRGGCIPEYWWSGRHRHEHQR